MVSMLALSVATLSARCREPCRGPCQGPSNCREHSRVFVIGLDCRGGRKALCDGAFRVGFPPVRPSGDRVSDTLVRGSRCVMQGDGSDPPPRRNSLPPLHCSELPVRRQLAAVSARAKATRLASTTPRRYGYEDTEQHSIQQCD